MNNLFASQETLVNLTADKVEWYRTLNPPPRANRTDAAEPVNGVENAPTLHQRILRRTHAIKCSTRHRLRSAKHGLVRIVKQAMGRS